MMHEVYDVCLTRKSLFLTFFFVSVARTQFKPDSEKNIHNNSNDTVVHKDVLLGVSMLTSAFVRVEMSKAKSPIKRTGNPGILELRNRLTACMLSVDDALRRLKSAVGRFRPTEEHE